MFSMEQPKYAPTMSNLQYLKEHFDFMITYNQDNTYPGIYIYIYIYILLYIPLNIEIYFCLYD